MPMFLSLRNPVRKGARRRAGFSLLELSVVLAIIGTVMAGGMLTLSANLQAKQYNSTVDRMDIIHKAILDYVVVFGKLPCPASLTLEASDTNYGVEAASNGDTCIGGTPAANYNSGTLVEGGVPVKTLKLPVSFLYDAWGRKLRYAVNATYTAASSFPSPGACTTQFTVNDASGTARTTTGVYVLMSHGQNGHGAFMKKGGSYVNAGITNTDELANCHCTNAGVAGAYSATYVQKLPTTSTSTATDVFDDIVTYREAWQLQSPNAAITASACTTEKYIYVTEWGNDRVSVFDLDGAFVRKFGSAGSGNGQFNNPSGVALDSSGNIYVVDSANYRVQKFDSNGNYVSQFGSEGRANGQFSCEGPYTGCAGYIPVAIAIDSNDNIYVTDEGNYRVQVFNTSGVYQRQLGCASGNCGYSSDAPGTFNQYMDAVAVDASGNVYVGDGDPTHYIQKFDSSGTYVTTYCGFAGPPTNNTCYGIHGMAIDQTTGDIYNSDGGWDRIKKMNSSFTYQTELLFWQFSPLGMALDGEGNIWVVDDGRNRVQKYDTTTLTYQNLQVGCASGDCSAGSADGQLSAPFGVAIH